MIPLAFSTNAYGRFSLDEAVADIAAAGYAGIELLGDKPHIWPPTFTQADAAKLRARLDSLGLSISNINANCTFGYFRDAPPEPFFEPSLVSPQQKMRDDRLVFIELTLQIASWLGAKNISITSGRLLIPPKEAWRVLVENLKRVCDRAAAAGGIRIGIETEPALFIETSAELAEVIDRVGSPLLGANLDLGHVFVMGESPADAISKLKGRIWNVHIEDLPGRKHYHMIPGTGSYDFAAAYRALSAAGYDRFATVELYTCGDNPGAAARAAVPPLKAAGFGAP
ncbi:MAG: sugar phosphate isomerase/epimerase [Phycisphaerae bacterium]|nr:sugar phosphate isomerase/epimerase [Phycisphaerae bacterium]